MRRSKRRILWVDDEAFALDYYRQLLADVGVLLDLETDTARAVSRLRGEQYTLVFVDLLLPPDRSDPVRHPAASSMKLLDEIRDMGPSAPSVVVVTALVEPNILDEVRAKGVAQIVHKPVDFDSIQRIVERYVGSSHEDSDW